MPFNHLSSELRVFSGVESLVALTKELKRSGCQRAVVVAGRSVIASGAMASLREVLARQLVGESNAVRPNSPVSAVTEVADALRAFGADAVIAVGGGSAVVTARAASILLAEERPVHDLCTRRLPGGEFESPRLAAPKLAQFVVATTPSTAFVRAGSAVHDDSGERLALYDPKTRARGLFLHPEFLQTAPVALVESATLNTLSTAIEGLESPTCDPLSEGMLMQSLRLIARHIGRVHADGWTAREGLAVAAVLCGRGTEQSGGGLSSVLAHAIGHRVHVANGTVNAIVLPQTMRFNASQTQRTSQRIQEGLTGSSAARSFNQPVSAVESVEALLATLNVPRRLRDIGVAQVDLDSIAAAAIADWFISRNPRRVSDVGEVRALLDAVW